MWIGYAQCIGMRSVDNKRFAHTTIIHQYRRPRTHTIACSSSLSHASTVFRPVPMWFSVHQTVFVCFFFPARIVTFIHIFFSFLLAWFSPQNGSQTNRKCMQICYLFHSHTFLMNIFCCGREKCTFQYKKSILIIIHNSLVLGIHANMGVHVYVYVRALSFFTLPKPIFLPLFRSVLRLFLF